MIRRRLGLRAAEQRRAGDAIDATPVQDGADDTGADDDPYVITDPETMPEYAGFRPRPAPNVIATFKTKGEALAISKGLDRDRAVDESGNQIAVFGRRGARPFGYEDVTRMLRTYDGTGEFFFVSDQPGK